jgi:hypothetical protein
MSDHHSSKNSYGFFSRLLHKLALDYPFIAETTFDIEQAAARTTTSSPVIKPVFIAGLARSGTTALLTRIYETGVFRSLTYRDMPFVLMTSVWKNLSGTKPVEQEKKERAHGDGILVNAESPEAFEEVFWRTFCHKSYIHHDYLSPHKVNSEMVKKFRFFVSSVVNSAGDPQRIRYLSKNNNNLLRLAALKKAFSDAVIIVPFRDPVQQSISLMNQHQKFCQRHDEDEFSLKYMNWLAHHEFGMGHKPFRFDVASGSPATYQPDEINYWLTIWNDSYQFILKTASNDSYFLCFEQLCEQTTEEVAQLYAFADIPHDNNIESTAFRLPPEKAAENIDPNLVSKCDQTYQEMVQRRALTN